MRVYKNGISREIDTARQQEFREKGYCIEGEGKPLSEKEITKLQEENKKLQEENKKLQEIIEQAGGEENADKAGKTKTSAGDRK